MGLHYKLLSLLNVNFFYILGTFPYTLHTVTYCTMPCFSKISFSRSIRRQKYTIKSEPIVSVIWNFEFQKEYGFYRNVTIKTVLTNLQKLDVFTSSQFSDLDLAPSVQNPRADALSILNLAEFIKTCMFYFGRKKNRSQVLQHGFQLKLLQIKPIFPV